MSAVIAESVGRASRVRIAYPTITHTISLARLSSTKADAARSGMCRPDSSSSAVPMSAATKPPGMLTWRASVARRIGNTRATVA